MGQSELRIQNSVIDNHSFASVFAINSQIQAENCVISNAGTYIVALVAGSAYSFIHCTMPNYFTHISRHEPGFVFTNNAIYENQNYENNLELYVGNSIIYGSQPNEIGIGISSGPLFDYQFENCLIRQDDGISQHEDLGYFNNVIISQDPNFISTKVYKCNFKLDTLSPAKDQGSLAIGSLVPTDLEGNSRLIDIGPDMGAFERIEKLPYSDFHGYDINYCGRYFCM